MEEGSSLLRLMGVVGLPVRAAILGVLAKAEENSGGGDNYEGLRDGEIGNIVRRILPHWWLWPHVAPHIGALILAGLVEKAGQGQEKYRLTDSGRVVYKAITVFNMLVAFS